ncbi:MurR/RpiR family transcriptional regulator [Jeotgalibacillus haloalkalitolerans]|uniref:SIS domain-containing protein n=1 Tax=Jeotgalibacillus haloalkalitolerans TaxID=3104292 RepID=A0ABU5KJS1_9BACL|nr:SIS domain-containing protein [Jeotgalibacillus sp. HH7-29]MDZ5711328.1 SIS domain-containing protein [Jeotgalibacillus sp. HH7-29]
MLKVVTEHLTKLEKEVHEKLSGVVLHNQNLKIIEAADICEVSPSKVSKLVRKLGFDNFKQYKQYFSGQEINLKTPKKSSEIDRLMQFLENFDHQIIDEFVSIFQKYNRIILFGLGPSFISAEYFAYKLATVSEKNVTVTQSEDFAERLTDEDSLLIVFSVTGKFTSFDSLFSNVKENGSSVMLLLEEYVSTFESMADYVFHLSKYNQDHQLEPFEKTRTVFFIFIEEVITKLSTLNKNKEE